ncbi:MAG: hypothetical protein EOM53_06080, partial [Alphaproteobacteria bacterium]|nr:hypothetical protein [Alphaproteobacteria bacterium]
MRNWIKDFFKNNENGRDMKREVKIIATLGPASCSRVVLLRMAQAGMDIVRLNFSHGTHQEHEEKIDIVRDINKRNGFDIKILQDLEGYRIRIGRLNKPIVLTNNSLVSMGKEGCSKDVAI